MMVTLLVLLLAHLMGENAAGSTTVSNLYFVGKEHWNEEELDLCETLGQLNESLSCYSSIINYQRIDVEVLSEDPILVVFRKFASDNYVAGFLADAKKKKYHTAEIIHPNGTYSKQTVRRAREAAFEHEETIGVAKVFRRVKAMLPSVNFEISEPWAILSYRPGGHYALHYDYLDYSSPEEWDSWRRDYGDRFATFLLMLQPATKGGGTVFPSLGTTVMPSSGDALLWTNMNANEEVNLDSLHGGCAVWEGEKIAAVLWIRANGQDLLRSSYRNGRLDIGKLIRPRVEYFGMTRANT
ncbi:oxidoreductase, 2OG-Fe(II) oxygenase family protein [Ostertagia ostertagi]